MRACRRSWVVPAWICISKKRGKGENNEGRNGEGRGGGGWGGRSSHHLKMRALLWMPRSAVSFLNVLFLLIVFPLFPLFPLFPPLELRWKKRQTKKKRKREIDKWNHTRHYWGDEGHCDEWKSPTVQFLSSTFHYFLLILWFHPAGLWFPLLFVAYCNIYVRGGGYVIVSDEVLIFNLVISSCRALVYAYVSG